jgi:hypothetical protein
MFKRAFRQAVRKYLNTKSPTEADCAKVEIEKLVNSTTESDARETIQEILTEFGILTEWLENHFTPGSLFASRQAVYGWHRPDQLQAELLPLALSRTYAKGFMRKIKVIANRDGFRVAEALPFVDGFPVEITEGKTHLFARHGWATAVPLQWHWAADGYIVDRSVIGWGFCRAWKWWPGAADYYAKTPPSQMQECLDFTGAPARDF